MFESRKNNSRVSIAIFCTQPAVIPKNKPPFKFFDLYNLVTVCKTPRFKILYCNATRMLQVF